VGNEESRDEMAYVKGPQTEYQRYIRTFNSGGSLNFNVLVCFILSSIPTPCRTSAVCGVLLPLSTNKCTSSFCPDSNFFKT
jgi:hypothetical protein